MTDPDPAGLADERFAANLREGRERLGLSQAQVARKMAEHGHSFHPQTVQRIEAGERKVTIGEAPALAQIVGMTIERMMLPGREAASAGTLSSFTTHTLTAYQQVSHWTEVLLVSRSRLEGAITGAEKADFHGSDLVRELVADGRKALKTATVEHAVEAGCEAYEHPELSGPPGLAARPTSIQSG